MFACTRLDSQRGCVQVPRSWGAPLGQSSTDANLHTAPIGACRCRGTRFHRFPDRRTRSVSTGQAVGSIHCPANLIARSIFRCEPSATEPFPSKKVPSDLVRCQVTHFADRGEQILFGSPKFKLHHYLNIGKYASEVRPNIAETPDVAVRATTADCAQQRVVEQQRQDRRKMPAICRAARREQLEIDLWRKVAWNCPAQAGVAWGLLLRFSWPFDDFL